LASPREITLDQFPIELGRGVNVGVRIDDRWLSRRHCEISAADGLLVVRDLGSRQGTFINGQAVVESTLRPGDELCIGLSHFVAVYLPESASVAAGSASHESTEIHDEIHGEIHDSAELALA